MASQRKLSEFKVLTLDCYGTLIDWTQGLIEAFKEVGYTDEEMKKLIDLFGTYETKVQSDNPTWLYPRVLEEVLRLIGQETNRSFTDEQLKGFGKSIAKWPPFPDSPAALKELQKYYKLVILSNVDEESFQASANLLQIKFDLICTAQKIGSYKPSLKNFEYVIAEVKRAFNVDRDQILHTFQSLFHDAVPASKMQLATAYINRQVNLSGATPLPNEPYKLDFTFTTLAEMAEAAKKEFESNA